MEKIILLIGFLLPAAAYSAMPMRCLSQADKSGQYVLDISDVNVPYMANTAVVLTQTQGGKSRTAQFQLLHAASKISPYVFFHDTFEVIVDHRSQVQNNFRGELIFKDRRAIKLICQSFGR